MVATMHPSRITAFTLIEMAIVLVIIGLVAGGVLVGKELIDNAQLSSVIRDIEKYETAVNTFRIKYDCLPGDCRKATTYFGALNADPTTCYGTNTSANSTLTCDGDGDGHISPVWPNTYLGFSEGMRFWQQLRSAGFIEGNYTGRTEWPSNNNFHNGQNVGITIPATRWRKNVGFRLEYLDGSDPAQGLYFGHFETSHIMRIHNVMEVWGTMSDYSSDAARFWDIKADDGVPYNGRVRVMANAHPGAPNWLNPCGIADRQTAFACPPYNCWKGGTYPAVPSDYCSAYFMVKF